MMPLRYESTPFEPPRGWEALVEAALRQPFAVFFDSALPGALATHSFISFAPALLLSCTGQTATFQRGRNASRLEGDPLALFERVRKFTDEECPLKEAPDAPGFIGGWAGLLGYDLRVFIEELRPPRPEGPLFPDLQAGFYPWVIARDNTAGRVELRLLNGAPGGPHDIEQLKGDLTELFSRQSVRAPHQALGDVQLATDREAWLKSVERVKTHIYEGDIYQANLTRMVKRPGTVDAPALYMALREENAAPFGGYLDCGEARSVLSSSPERFVSLHDGVVETRPIKGTRPRSDDPTEDARLREELEGSEKDHAELTMIVDLERNDLGRVCEPGTVKVPSLMHVESYRRVHHLEATVRGRLRGGVTPEELIRATFPGGSISGAPKKRALEIIHDLEPVRRGPYTGSLFWLTPDHRFESNILIRTLLSEPTGVSYHVGCGIVADSDPADEWDETLAKASALESALRKYAEGS